jgi:uncharacterized protein YerC
MYKISILKSQIEQNISSQEINYSQLNDDMKKLVNQLESDEEVEECVFFLKHLITILKANQQSLKQQIESFVHNKEAINAYHQNILLPMDE